MGGAVGIHFIWLRFVAHAPPSTAASRKVDARLVGGAVTFGIGWGLSGYCPGPALSALAFGRVEGFVFTLAMLGGILVFRFAAREPLRPTEPGDAPPTATPARSAP
jgi:uncharacterized membrane protein YedE/YeeE